jgi:hypothetical protein
MTRSLTTQNSRTAVSKSNDAIYATLSEMEVLLRWNQQQVVSANKRNDWRAVAKHTAECGRLNEEIKQQYLAVKLTGHEIAERKTKRYGTT